MQPLLGVLIWGVASLSGPAVVYGYVAKSGTAASHERISLLQTHTAVQVTRNVHASPSDLSTSDLELELEEMRKYADSGGQDSTGPPPMEGTILQPTAVAAASASAPAPAPHENAQTGCWTSYEAYLNDFACTGDWMSYPFEMCRYSMKSMTPKQKEAECESYGKTLKNPATKSETITIIKETYGAWTSLTGLSNLDISWKPLTGKCTCKHIQPFTGGMDPGEATNAEFELIGALMESTTRDCMTQLEIGKMEEALELKKEQGCTLYASKQKTIPTTTNLGIWDSQLSESGGITYEDISLGSGWFWCADVMNSMKLAGTLAGDATVLFDASASKTAFLRWAMSMYFRADKKKFFFNNGTALPIVSERAVVFAIAYLMADPPVFDYTAFRSYSGVYIISKENYKDARKEYMLFKAMTSFDRNTDGFEMMRQGAIHTARETMTYCETDLKWDAALHCIRMGWKVCPTSNTQCNSINGENFAAQSWASVWGKGFDKCYEQRKTMLLQPNAPGPVQLQANVMLAKYCVHTMTKNKTMCELIKGVVASFEAAEMAARGASSKMELGIKKAIDGLMMSGYVTIDTFMWISPSNGATGMVRDTFRGLGAPTKAQTTGATPFSSFSTRMDAKKLCDGLHVANQAAGCSGCAGSYGFLGGGSYDGKMCIIPAKYTSSVSSASSSVCTYYSQRLLATYELDKYLMNYATTSKKDKMWQPFAMDQAVIRLNLTYAPCKFAFYEFIVHLGKHTFSHISVSGWGTCSGLKDFCGSHLKLEGGASAGWSTTCEFAPVTKISLKRYLGYDPVTPESDCGAKIIFGGFFRRDFKNMKKAYGVEFSMLKYLKDGVGIKKMIPTGKGQGVSDSFDQDNWGGNKFGCLSDFTYIGKIVPPDVQVSLGQCTAADKNSRTCVNLTRLSIDPYFWVPFHLDRIDSSNVATSVLDGSPYDETLNIPSGGYFASPISKEEVTNRATADLQVNVYVVDSGIALDHVEFSAPKCAPTAGFRAVDFANRTKACFPLAYNPGFKRHIDSRRAIPYMAISISTGKPDLCTKKHISGGIWRSKATWASAAQFSSDLVCSLYPDTGGPPESFLSKAYIPAKRLLEECKTGKGCVCNCAVDKCGHGTLVAGIVGGRNVGVNRLAQLYSVKAMSDSCIATANSLQTAFYTIAEWHRIPGVTVLSTEQHDRQTMFYYVLEYMSARGMILVCSAGNLEKDACLYQPMGIDKTVSVGASALTTNSAGVSSDTISWFSNGGFCVDLYAPGSQMWSSSQDTADNVWGRASSGTSFSSPLVAGVISLLYLSFDFDLAVGGRLVTKTGGGKQGWIKSSKFTFEGWWKTTVLKLSDANKDFFDELCSVNKPLIKCSVDATQRHSNMWPGTLKTTKSDSDGKQALQPRYRAMMMGVALMKFTKFSNSLTRTSEQSYLSSSWWGVNAFIATTAAENTKSVMGSGTKTKSQILAWFKDPESRCTYRGVWPGMSVKVTNNASWGASVCPSYRGVGCLDIMELYCRFFAWRKRQMRRTYLPGPDGARPERACTDTQWSSTLAGDNANNNDFKFSVFPGKLSWYVNPLCFHWVASTASAATAYMNSALGGACSGLPVFSLVSLKR